MEKQEHAADDLDAKAKDIAVTYLRVAKVEAWMATRPRIRKLCDATGEVQRSGNACEAPIRVEGRTMYNPKKTSLICNATDAINVALHHEQQHDPQGTNTYALLALAMSANQRIYRTIPADGWVLLERSEQGDLLVHHVMAFQEAVSRDGAEREDLYPVVWITGEGLGVAYQHEAMMLVRGAATCVARTFTEIADGKATDAERDWIVSRYPMLQKNEPSTP